MKLSCFLLSPLPLGHFGQEVQRAEDLEVMLRSASQVPTGWAGTAAAVMLFCSINHRTVFGHPHDASQAEGIAKDVLGRVVRTPGAQACF